MAEPEHYSGFVGKGVVVRRVSPGSDQPTFCVHDGEQDILDLLLPPLEGKRVLIAVQILERVMDMTFEQARVCVDELERLGLDRHSVRVLRRGGYNQIDPPHRFVPFWDGWTAERVHRILASKARG